MKFNFPTKKVVGSLLLLNIVTIPPVKTGSELHKCLGTDMYNKIITYTNTNNIPDKKYFCCQLSNQTCVLSKEPYSFSASDCPWPIDTGRVHNQCSRIGRSTFCIIGFPSPALTAIPGNYCGGILGDTPPTNVTVGTCPNFDTLSSSLIKESTTLPTFTWMCCDSEICTVPTNVTIISNQSGTWATTNCANGQYSLMCFADNNGWVCAGNISPHVDVWPQRIGTCIIQVAISGVTECSDEKKTTVIETVNSNDNEGLPTWGTAMVGVGSSAVTALTVVGVQFCWNRRLPLTVLRIPGGQG